MGWSACVAIVNSIVSIEYPNLGGFLEDRFAALRAFVERLWQAAVGPSRPSSVPKKQSFVTRADHPRLAFQSIVPTIAVNFLPKAATRPRRRMSVCAWERYVN